MATSDSPFINSTRSWSPCNLYTQSSVGKGVKYNGVKEESCQFMCIYLLCPVRSFFVFCFVLFCFVFFQFTNICPLMLRRLSVRDDWGSETWHTIKFIDGLEKRTTSSVFVHVAIASWRVSNTLIKCLEKTTKAMFVTSSQWTPSDKEGASESYVIPKELLWCESLCTHVNTWYQNAVLIQLKHFQNQFEKRKYYKNVFLITRTP